MKLRLRHKKHSLSSKLMLLFIVMALLVVLLVGAGLKQVFHSHFKENIRPHLIQYMEYVRKDIGSPPNRGRALAMAKALNIEIHIIDKQGKWSSSQQQVNLEKLTINHRFKENGKLYFHLSDKDNDYIMTREGGATILFNVPHVRQKLRGIKGYLPLLVLLLVLLFLYYATRRIFAPIETIRAGVQRFGNGDLQHRITVNRRDELGELAVSINTMADDIQQMLDAKRQLLLAISHELRSPITRAKVATELLEHETQKQHINQELDEMETLIEELMETERLSTPHKILNTASHDLSEIIKDVRQTYFKDATVIFTLPNEPLMIEVDAPRIKLLLKNLISNALQHTPDGQPAPKVIVMDEHDKIQIQVKDEGAGIEEKHIPHLTQPFYRVDPSRQRKTGGYGLGLYLCKMIAEAHGGKLRIESSTGKGTTVTVTLFSYTNI